MLQIMKKQNGSKQIVGTQNFFFTFPDHTTAVGCGNYH